ncbi:hypothetical protein A3A76_01615 [Candidatus Woesebacteria bacterium RIFCSPLOWO2_01_FULL_39_23]|uniref:Uncharacterized protein n=1 Tax=Candidatus Woesebacteria bacterium RIFCSPHIGHO2_01_FULL_40_22 TaxID=1802499 RepID=A0A1F7YEM6_9BACT|nr:MAG: hypothetical protein A2141_02190 [Candidatus Woesebacteria bacterium RBG_16_40_11]OGM25781.1 MAG: hypothetical protein A2628_00470 [Candidatus Woesebacteria bacterium RIFCSPHIGHO2_01_FULL_40_22]OGM61733.1 MAG: hypothetical protein A3A76_01615 [Candidatus Woesebacteria bacterium RIFCSPLOWO2_01_FULL_39_23]
MNAFNSFLRRKMNRREFLIYLGLFFVTITGISGVLKSISNHQMIKPSSRPQKSSFGIGPYGGTNRESLNG